MKFEPNHIDDLFRRRLHDAESTPPAFVWPNVERELRKRRRRGIFFWLFALGAVGAGLWGFLHQRTAQPALATTQIILENENEKNNKIQPSSTAELPGKNGVTMPVLEISTAHFSPRQEAKQGLQMPLSLVQELESKGVKTLNVNEKESIAILDQAIQTSNAFSEFLFLNGIQTEPLVFQRKNILPQAKPFIRKKKNKQYCYNFAENPNVLLLDAYAGPTFAFRDLTADNLSFEPYRQQRLDTEQQDWAFNAGIRASLLFKRHFLVRAGLHYEQKTDVFEHFDPNYVKYIVEIINQPGEPPIIDTIDVQYGENYVKTFNRFGMLDVPLELGAEVRRGRFGLSLNGGLSLNVLFWKRGAMLSPSGNPKYFTPGKQGATEVFRPRTGLSVQGSAQLFFHLQPRLRVFAEPYFRQILKPITLTGHPVEQRYGAFGVKLGMTKILD